MSGKERGRLRVVQAVRARRMKQAEAAAQLGISVRQVKRLVRSYREAGAKALVSKRRGLPSNRRIATRERERILKLVARHYADFGPTLAVEYLRDRHGFTHSVETLRQWLIAAGRHRPKRRQRTRPYQLRERRAQAGELIQIDGSPHAWLEERGPRCTLLAFVDDATSRLQYTQFVGAETTRGYLHALRAYALEHGRPAAFYSDRHSIFRKHDPEDPEPTQFERAVRALDIMPILALSPQAKGRVERTFQTLQDRLVKALRLARINSIAAANAFLPTFMTEYNTKFAKPPRADGDAHRPLHVSATELAFITCEQHPRKLSKSLSCQYRGQLYLIQTGASPGYHLRGAAITVCDDGAEQAFALLRAGQPLPFKVFPRHTLLPRIADDKTVNDMVDTARRKQAKAGRPNAANHPWKAATNPAAAAARAAPAKTRQPTTAP